MKEKGKEILKRYYVGESSIEEERMLKTAFRKGEFVDEPILALKKEKQELPEGLMEKIQENIHRQSISHIRYWSITAASVAALVVLIITFRGLQPRSDSTSLQLSDNMKKEQFEKALRVIGTVLEEKVPKTQKVLYEDNKLIITIE